MHIFKIIIAVFALVAAFDKITGNHLKLGDEFEKGIMMCGTLSLAMIGLVVLTPAIAKALTPIFNPICNVLHIDPSFISSFIVNDSGGAALGRELSNGSIWGGLHGIIVSSMLGGAICFGIPVTLKMVDKSHHKEILNGFLCGIITIPIGCLVSGIIIGCPLFELLLNLMPVIIFSIVVSIGIVFNANLCRKIFSIIGKVILGILTFGLAVGTFDYLTGIKLIPYIDSIDVAFDTVWGIALTLSGIFPFILVLSRILKKLLLKLGSVLKINDYATLGLITTLSSSVLTITLMDKMDRKGLMMNAAFIISAQFVFGDHLAFTMVFDKNYLFAMIVGKLTSGILSLVVVNFYYSYNNSLKHLKNR